MPTRPEDLKKLTDRDLMEAVYRGIYGEEPIHPGLAKRVSRVERAILAIFALLISAGVISIGPDIIEML